MTKRSATALVCLIAMAATPATAAPDKGSSMASKQYAEGERIIAKLKGDPRLLNAYVANLKARVREYQTRPHGRR